MTRPILRPAGGVLVGVLAAVALPLGSVGLGWLLVWAGLATLAWAARQPPAAGQARRLDPVRLGLGVLSGLLVAVGAVRAAGWLQTLCLLAALLVASVALDTSPPSAGRTWRGLLAATLTLPRAAVSGLAALPHRPVAALSVTGGVAALSVTGGVAALSATGGGERDTDGGSRPLRGPATGVGIAVLLALLVGGLLGAADQQFARTVRQVLPSLSVAGALLSLVSFAGAFAVAVGVVQARWQPGSAAPVADGPGYGAARPVRAWRPVEWLPVVAVLNVILGSFVAFQFTVWFSGHEHVLWPDGPTYAENARGGFRQLLAVIAIALGVIVAVAPRAAGSTIGQRVTLRAQIGALCLLSLVVVASAISRMLLYVDAYGFTRSRLLAVVLLGWIGVLLLLLLAAGVRLTAGWLPRTVLATAALTLLGLAAINPDAVVARTVIGRFEADGHLDAAYLSTLSPDAVEWLDRLPEPQRSCVLAAMAADLAEADPWHAANLGRSRARAVLAERPAVELGGYLCWQGLPVEERPSALTAGSP